MCRVRCIWWALAVFTVLWSRVAAEDNNTAQSEASLLGQDLWIPTRGALRQLFLENLEQDLRPWRQKVKLSGQLHAAEILKQHEAWRSKGWDPALYRLILIYNNTWLHLLPHKLNEPIHQLCQYECTNNGHCTPDRCHSHLEAYASLLASELATGTLKLPNCILLLSVADNQYRWCQPNNNCSVPTFSVIKWVGLTENDTDTDIVVPQMRWSQPLVFLPWHEKRDEALFRGTEFCGANRLVVADNRAKVCTRKYLAKLSAERPELGLDIGLIRGYKPAAAEYPLLGDKFIPACGHVSIWNHVHSKYLVHLEGISASSRLGQLLAINSVVLRAMESNHTEYFYRSLKPWQHYVPFFTKHRDDIIEVVSELRRMDKQEPAKLQAIVKNAQSFAVRCLTERAKLRYFKAAVVQYKRLFADMDQEVEQLVQRLKQAGFDFNPKPPGGIYRTPITAATVFPS